MGGSPINEALILPSQAASRESAVRRATRRENGTTATFLLLVFLVSWVQALADELGDAAEGARPSLVQEGSIAAVNGRFGPFLSVGPKDSQVYSAISFYSRAPVDDSECPGSAGAPCCSNPGEDCHCPRACAEIHTFGLPVPVVEVSGGTIGVPETNTDCSKQLTSAARALSIRPPILFVS
jgi:hypothetical protein